MQQIAYTDSPINIANTYKSPKKNIKKSILFIKSVERKPPQDGRAYKIREKIIAHATVANWSTSIPWWRNSFSKYNRWEHWARRYWIWESIFRLDWKMTPKSLLQSNCSISLTRGGRWKSWTLGRLKTFLLFCPDWGWACWEQPSVWCD